MASNLLIDVGPAVGDHGQRGIGRYVRGLAASIATFPEDLVERVWALGTPGPTLDTFGARGVSLVVPRWLRRAPMWASGQTAVRVALRRSHADVLHATDPQRPWNRADIASIVTVYDLIPLSEPETLRSWRVDHRLAYRRYIRQIRSAARIVAISGATAADLRERLEIPADRIDIVYPTVVAPLDVDRSEPPQPTFLFVGALDPHKQPELALQAFARFRARQGDGRLRFVGPSAREQTRRLHQMAARLGVAGSVFIEGRISDDQLERAYASATALLCTSRIEGFGLPPVEALLRGVPVIAVRTPAALETLDGAAAIVASDAEAIAEAMTHPRVPTDEAIAAIRARHAVASVARSLEDSYRRLLA